MASEIKAPIAGSMTELPTSHVPFVRFDGVVSPGANHGVIQLELAAMIVEPDPTEKAGSKDPGRGDRSLAVQLRRSGRPQTGN
jgi:hypothetical protein